MKSRIMLHPGLAGSLSPEDLERAVCGDIGAVIWDPAVGQRVEASSADFERWCVNGGAVYGTTTGVGPLVSHAIDPALQQEHARNIIDHLLVGAGDPLPTAIVKAAWLLRLHTLALGFSGVRQEMLQLMADFYSHDVWPEVPSCGSLGASGDLVPLAHLAVGFRTFSESRGFSLSAREALALVNGTSFLTAIGALGFVRLNRLLETQEKFTGLVVRLLGSQRDFLDSGLHEARGHPGQIESARRILAASGTDMPSLLRPLQERYSLRCTPQILGACREVLLWGRSVLSREIDGADDNPLVLPAEPQGIATVRHGGNFHGQIVGFVCDAMNVAATKMGSLAERQIALMVDPQSNGGLPPFLSNHPGALAGLAGVQLTATAVRAEMEQHVHPASASAPESNLANQDVVSLAFHAAWALWKQNERLAHLCALEAICIRRLASFSPGERDGIHSGELPDCRHDTPCTSDVRRLAAAYLEPTGD